MSYATEIPGRCSECGKVTDTLPCPHCIAATVSSVPDRHLRRCRGCGQWKDERVQCVLCHGSAPCPRCGHSTAAHSSEPGVGCLCSVKFPLADSTLADRSCPCTLPGTSGADQ